jgi:hypothetical protein
MKKRGGGSKAKAKQRKAPVARGRKTASPSVTGLRAIKGARHHEMAGVKIDSMAAANGQVKRVVYPPGFRWSTHMKPLIGTELCMHGHVGFLTAGRVHGQYADGCVFEFAAPQVVVVEPGHDAWVVGREPAVLIQFDAAAETAQRFGLPAEHRHTG